ncbi:hypothetical protein [Flavobacterium tibetense]|jgi:uncharacterized membrane protein|uniref:Uncharacterized protein n=1 Tax=Flavobacterium tibetense TaxID=2233533 RepID=A0A365P5J7_9FLAO|nr:hypothetical protein [Flavobacterium tibetense]RBA29881.1 hypothetical protein DPN68_01250 [Flavobacterium tibetense]
MNLHKIVKFAALAIGILSMVFLGGILATDEKDSAWISPLILVAYVILFACIAIVLIYVFKNLFAKQETLKKTLMSIGMFLGVVLLAFILADSSDVKAGGEIVSGTTSKLVSTGLNTFYFLALIAIGTMAWTGLTKFKK